MENQVKLSQEELEKLLNIKKEIDARQFELGRVEIIKSEILASVFEFNNQLNDVKKELSDKYGDCEIDLSDGTIKEKVSEESDIPVAE